MDEVAFDRVKTEIVRDFVLCLGSLGCLNDVAVHRTSDTARLIIATAFADPAVADEELAAALEEAWTTRLRYRYREAHVVRKAADSVSLQAISQIAPDGFYVTADVTVERRD